ncbi:MAG TPA: glycerophosphodiester phosphodiesterase family protein [Candidatus Bathyarchaeia archaeon]|nr:glycerophosphodiester phosphodiesterase family protein [Candidatus Bathyarchaeia archaeon]
MQQPVIFGHRGSSAFEPENTMRAFARAFQDGAKGIEFDIRLTKDEQIVIIHDEAINRTSNGSGLVKDMTFEELQQFDFGKGEKIPLLKDVLKLYGNRFWLNIEIKEVKLEKQLTELLIDMNITKKIVISSFIKETLEKIKEIDFNFNTAYLYAIRKINLNYIKNELKCEGIHPSKNNITKRLLKKTKGMKLAVRVWTVDNPKKAIKLAKLGVDGIITNNPKLITDTLQANSAIKETILREK